MTKRWIFYHADVADKFEVVATVKRLAFASTVEFYREATKHLLQVGAQPYDFNPEELDFVDDLDYFTERFPEVVNTLPEPYYVGVNEDLRLFVIVKPQEGFRPHDVEPGQILRKGKWILYDDDARETLWGVTSHKIIMEPGNGFLWPGQRFYHGAIKKMLEHGAKVTGITEPWNLYFADFRRLPEMFLEAIDTLPNRYWVGISDDLERFCIVKAPQNT